MYWIMASHGFHCFSLSVTACQGPAASMQPWKCNDIVNLNGTVVRPDEAIVGDQDRVVVVPAKVTEKVTISPMGVRRLKKLPRRNCRKTQDNLESCIPL